MTTPIQKYHDAHAAFEQARKALEQVTKETWPIGMKVWNNKFIGSKNGKPIACTVSGYGRDGAVFVRNDATDARHEVWPYSRAGWGDTAPFYIEPRE